MNPKKGRFLRVQVGSSHGLVFFFKCPFPTADTARIPILGGAVGLGFRVQGSAVKVGSLFGARGIPGWSLEVPDENICLVKEFLGFRV